MIEELMTGNRDARRGSPYNCVFKWLSRFPLHDVYPFSSLTV